jgi:hypothetical protein
MSGGAIGTQFNPQPETAWEGRISILKTGDQYTVKIDYLGGNDPAVDSLIQRQVNAVVLQLNQHRSK